MAIAHSVNEHGLRHDLVEHLRGVAEGAGRFAINLDAQQLAYYAGLWHDVGKFDPDFQSYLLRSEADPRARGHGPDHKAAGCALAARCFAPLGLVLQGHHGGLQPSAALKGWLRDKLASGGAERAIEIASAAIPDLMPAGELQAPAFVAKDALAAEFFLRLVFSALVDADFLDTEHHFASRSSAAREVTATLDDLWQRFEADQRSRFASTDGAVASVRREVYQNCLAAAGSERGFFRLTVPTGGGKTRSGMAFALQHARRHRMQRVIVAVPFISITEQTAQVYRDAFGNAANAVLEHHSMAEPPDRDDDYHHDAVWDRLAAENWDSPVIVTTAVQLFESLFSNRTSRTRKLHRLANSVIILDEAQALPPGLLTPILDALRQLVAYYGTTVVISTATQPAFEAIPVFREVQATELVPRYAEHFAALQRVDYEWRTAASVTWDEAASWLRQESQALAILNTKKDALALLDALGDPDALHLSTLLCGAHRREVLAEVKRRLDTGEPCRVVSTQVVEAGVDVDFPFVMRALGPLDSVIQAAGRCNREGRQQRGRVVVFEPGDGSVPYGHYRIGRDATRVLVASGAPIDANDPVTVRAYFRQVLDYLGPAGTDAKKIQPARRVLDYPTVAREFRMIEDETYSVVITTYGDVASRAQIQDRLNDLAAGSAQARRIRRDLQPYVVAVPSRQAQRLVASGLIRELRPGIGEWMGGYDAVRGFTGTDPDPDTWSI